MQTNKNLLEGKAVVPVTEVGESGTQQGQAVKAAEVQAAEVPAAEGGAVSAEVQASGGGSGTAEVPVSGGGAVSAEVPVSGGGAVSAEVPVSGGGEVSAEVQASGGAPQAAGTASEVPVSGGAEQLGAPLGGAVSAEVQASGAEAAGTASEVPVAAQGAAKVQASGEGVVTVNGKPVTEQSKSGVLAPAGGTADLLTGKNDAQIMAGAEIAAVAVLAAASKIQVNPVKSEPRKDTKIKSLFLDNLHLFFGDTHLKPIKDFIDPSHQLDETHEMNRMNEFDREDYERDRLIKLLKTMFFRESNGIISKVFVGGGITIDQLKKKIKKGISLIVPKY